MTSNVHVNDVIQMDPAECRWGPIFLVVSEVRSWGVVCHAKIPGQEGTMWLRAKTGTFAVIGQAFWTVAPSSDRVLISTGNDEPLEPSNE